MSAALFGSTYTQTQIGARALSAPSNDAGLLKQVNDMGGLQLVMPDAFAAGPCTDLLQSGRHVVEFNLVGRSVDLPIMGGKTYKAMTFNEQVPGPTLRVTQGDVVHAKLTVPADEKTQHGNDMHASQMSAKPYMGAVKIGETGEYCYVADVPGTFKYHCSGVNVAAMDQHVLSGMYGLTIVDPLNGYNKLVVTKTKVDGGKVSLDRQVVSADALEYQLQYNQLYLTEDGSYDGAAMMSHKTTQTVVNGMAFGYTPSVVHNEAVNKDKSKNIFVVQPWNNEGGAKNQYQGQILLVPTGKHVRFFVENQGNMPVFFHIVGEIIDRVTQANRVQAQGTETWLIGGSQGAIMDVVFDDPGAYVAVNHDYAAIFSGAASVIVAGDPFGLTEDPSTDLAVALGAPSDAVPPMGKNSIAHPKLNLHGLYTDARAAEIASELGI